MRARERLVDVRSCRNQGAATSPRFGRTNGVLARALRSLSALGRVRALPSDHHHATRSVGHSVGAGVRVGRRPARALRRGVPRSARCRGAEVQDVLLVSSNDDWADMWESCGSTAYTAADLPFGSMRPEELIRNEQDLLTATGLVDREDLANALWAYVDGVVHWHDEGIDLQPGFQTETLLYPFRLQDLYDVAAELERTEVPMQAAAGAPPAPATKARQAKDAHSAFEPKACRLASEALGPGFRAFAPRAMTTFGWWYEDAAGRRLLAIVAPTELATVPDEVLAYALAWQQDRELILILSRDHAAEVTRRLPWIDSPVEVRTLDGGKPALDRSQVLWAAAALPVRTVIPFGLNAAHTAWIARLLADPAVQALDAHARANYLSWHYRGLQVLRVAPARGGLRVQAGVKYSRPQAGHKTFEEVIAGPLTDAQLAEVMEAVSGSVAAGGSRTTRQTEHRLQASLGASPPPSLGLPYLAREYPGYRGPGRPGYIDFLGCDPDGILHIVETKVGHDPTVVLQALDYGIWVQANEDAVRRARPDWPRPASPQRQMHLDFVLAAGDAPTAVGPYIASQLEALAQDVLWRVFVVPDLDAHPSQPALVRATDLWTHQPEVTSLPVRPPRASSG